MKNIAKIIGGIAVVLLMGAFYLLRPSSAPLGQDQLVTLSNANFSQFENAFDSDSNLPRLVLLLSPT